MWYTCPNRNVNPIQFDICQDTVEVLLCLELWQCKAVDRCCCVRRKRRSLYERSSRQTSSQKTTCPGNSCKSCSQPATRDLWSIERLHEDCTLCLDDRIQPNPNQQVEASDFRDRSRCCLALCPCALCPCCDNNRETSTVRRGRNECHCQPTLLRAPSNLSCWRVRIWGRDFQSRGFLLQPAKWLCWDHREDSPISWFRVWFYSL